MGSKKHSRPVDRPATPASTGHVPPASSSRSLSPLVALIAVAVISGAGFWWFTQGSAYVLKQEPNQNILLITIDTLRGDALGAYGGRAATPNLDRLAASGARFTFAHSHAVVTLPSHTSILTGTLPYEHGMRDNSGFRVKDGTETLATRLKRLGFSTGAFVGGFPLTKRFGLSPGFDTYDDQIPELRGDVTFTMPERPANEVVDRALAWIDRTPDKFFGWVHVFDPHSPYAPPAPFAGQYPQPYDGEVAWVDSALGPLLDRLSALSRPTTVIVTADHGESLGEHGEATHGMFAYEATLHVPLIVATVTPGQSSQGRVVTSPVRHIDIAPTVMDAVGEPTDPSWLGASLRPLIDSGDGPDRPSYFESMTYNLVRGWAPLRGVLQERTKYIDQPIPELYDLALDAEESRNFASADTQRLQVLTNLLRTFNVAPPNRPDATESAEVSAALRSLGYVSGSAPARDVYTEADDLKNLVDIDQSLHRASEMFQSGRTAEGIAELESAITKRPDTADAYISLAYAYWESGQIDPAIKTLERGLTNGAPDRDLRIRLGIYLAESRTDIPKAIALLETLPGTDVEALNGLGLAYAGAGRYQDAITAFKKILSLDSTNGLANQNIAAMLMEEAERTPALRGTRLREAEGYVKQALDNDPSLAKAYTTYGVILAQTNRKTDAIENWKKAVQLDPGEFDALYNLVMLLDESGRMDEARRFAQQFVATAPPAFYGPEIAQLRQRLG